MSIIRQDGNKIWGVHRLLPVYQQASAPVAQFLPTGIEHVKLVEKPRSDLDPKKLSADVRIWLDKVESALGVRPMIYASADFYRSHLSALTEYPLWIAEYDVEVLRITGRKWTFWQHSDTGQLPGIEGDVDLDWFQGSLADLNAFVNGSRREIAVSAHANGN